MFCSVAACSVGPAEAWQHSNIVLSFLKLLWLVILLFSVKLFYPLEEFA